MSRRSRRGEVAKRGSLVAVLTADVSRAEFFLVFSTGNARPKRVKVVRVTPQGVTRLPDRVDSGGPRSQLEGRGQHRPCCGPPTTRYLVRWGFSCMALRGITSFLASVFRGLRPIRLTLCVTIPLLRILVLRTSTATWHDTGVSFSAPMFLLYVRKCQLISYCNQVCHGHVNEFS